MKKLIWALLVVLISIFILAAPALAASIQADPDSPPVVTDKWAARNLAQAGDMLLFFKVQIPYAAQPVNNVTASFTFELWNYDDTLLLGYNHAFAWPRGGYDPGVVSFYFTPDTNPGWGVDYKLHIKGNAGYFITPPDYSYDILADQDYSAQTDQAAARAEVRTKIVAITRDLERSWSGVVIPPATSPEPVVLLDQSDVGDVLSLDGELYYREAIPQLQFLCPNLFYFQLADPRYGERSWTNNAQPAIDAQYSGTQMAVGVQAGGDILGVSPMVTGAIVVMVVCIFLVYIHIKQAASINSGLMDIYPVVLVSSLMSFFPFVIAVL